MCRSAIPHKALRPVVQERGCRRVILAIGKTREDFFGEERVGTVQPVAVGFTTASDGNEFIRIILIENCVSGSASHDYLNARIPLLESAENSLPPHQFPPQLAQPRPGDDILLGNE